MPEEPREKSWLETGIESGFDDAWHEEWWKRMEDSGGNIIAAMRMRMVEVSDERLVMEMPMGPAVRQGTGVFAAGALMQLADVAATSAYFHWARRRGEDDAPFPLSIQISTNLLRNTDRAPFAPRRSSRTRAAPSSSPNRASRTKPAACSR